jgi:hypothetical protein
MNLYFINLIHSSSQNFDPRRQPIKNKGLLLYGGLYPIVIDEVTFLPYNGMRNEDGTRASISFGVSDSIRKRMINNVNLTTLIVMGERKYSSFSRFRIGKRRYNIYNYLTQRTQQEFIDLFSNCKFSGFGRTSDDGFCMRENKRGEIYLSLVTI